MKLLATAAFCLLTTAASAQDNDRFDAFKYVISSTLLQSNYPQFAQPRPGEKLDQPQPRPVGVFVPWPPARVVPAPSVAPPAQPQQQPPEVLLQHPVFKPKQPERPTVVIRYSAAILPPVEFDKPYDGDLVLNQVDTEQDVAELCRLGAATRLRL